MLSLRRHSRLRWQVWTRIVSIVKSEITLTGIEKTDMTFSLKKIRYFIATAEAGQVSHAGIHLGVSQSAITAAVQQLEDELGVSLFSRHPHGVSLTAEGARFLQLARNIMAAVNEAIRNPLSEDLKLSGQVLCGVYYTVDEYVIPPQ